MKRGGWSYDPKLRATNERRKRSDYVSPECLQTHDLDINLVSCSNKEKCTCTCHDPVRLHLDSSSLSTSSSSYDFDRVSNV